MTVRWRLLGCGAEEAGGPLLRSSTDCSRGLLFSELGAPLSVLSMSYLRVRVGLEANAAGDLREEWAGVREAACRRDEWAGGGGALGTVLGSGGGEGTVNRRGRHQVPAGLPRIHPALAMAGLQGEALPKAKCRLQGRPGCAVWG